MTTLFQQLASDFKFHAQLKCIKNDAAFFDRAMLSLRSRGLWFSLFYRIIHFSSQKKNVLSVKWWVMRLLEIPAIYLSAVTCKCVVLGDCEIEAGVYLPDAGHLMCGALAIGGGSIIHDHVTLGLAVAGKKPGRPRIGKNVWVGPNCIIAGGLEIGDGATILPGTYLTTSVPAGAVVRGNPARVVQKNFDNSEIRRSLAIVEDIAKA